MRLNIITPQFIVLFLFSLLGGLTLNQTALAQKGDTGVRCVAVAGSVLAQKKAGEWDPVAPKANVPADRLVIALFGADFASANGDVQARLISDVGQRGPFPVLEAAARFHDGAG